MAFLSRFITLFVLLAALQMGLARPPCKKKPTPGLPPSDATPTTPTPDLPVVTPTTPETPPKDNTTTPVSPSTPETNGTLSSDIQAFLQAHNTIRSQHGAAPLKWSDTLAGKAQEWASKCVFEHSGGKLGSFGENLAAGTGESYDIAAAVKAWTDEASEYDPKNPVYSHFTQVVWKATTELGCAVHICPSESIFKGSGSGTAKYVVCEYSPPGNVIGSFDENVQV